MKNHLISHIITLFTNLSLQFVGVFNYKKRAKKVYRRLEKYSPLRKPGLNYLQTPRYGTRELHPNVEKKQKLLRILTHSPITLIRASLPLVNSKFKRSARLNFFISMKKKKKKK